jgi:hypothetical protein
MLALMRADLAWPNANPSIFSVFWAGDFNFFEAVEGVGCAARVGSERLTSGQSWPGQIDNRWLLFISRFAEIDQPMCIGACSTVGRIFTSMPSRGVMQPRIDCNLVWGATWGRGEKISGHAPLRLRILGRAPLLFEQRPIPAWLGRLQQFSKTVFRFLDTQNILFFQPG